MNRIIKYSDYNSKSSSNNSEESLSEILEYLKNICLDLKDEGFSIRNYHNQNLYTDYFIPLNLGQLTIEINRFGGRQYSHEQFEISDVYETVYTISAYMDSIGYKTFIKMNNKDDVDKAVNRGSLNDISLIFDALMGHKTAPVPQQKHLSSGLGMARYIRLSFTKK